MSARSSLKGPLLAGLVAALAGCASPESEGPEIDGPVGTATSAITVQEAADTTCSTTSVKGLSEQIVAQADCLSPGAFVALPSAPNLTLGGAVFPYLEAPARDALVAALGANGGTAMHVSSMLRTVAQQYLLYQWDMANTCGIALAAKPGLSNHETGLALDVEEYAAWQAALEANGFTWFGNTDAVHYDFTGAGAVDYGGTDVKAFQMLWNLNNPGDEIAEDGVYGPQTEARLVASPAEGFPKAASCAAPGPDVWPAISIAGASDSFADHASSGVTDLFEGDTYSLALTIENKGSLPASNVEIGVAVTAPSLVASDYLVESDATHPGTFAVSDANDDPANPKHDAPPGEGFSLVMGALAPGETKRVTLTLTAEAYSIGPGEPPGVRLWVKDIPGAYHQDGFGEAPSKSTGQTFGGGTLQALAATDVYARSYWEWDSDRLEGWTPAGDATLSTDPDAKALLIGSAGADPGALSPPSTWIPTSAFSAIEIRAKRTGGDGKARLYFATDQDPALGEDKAIAFDLPDDDAFHDVVVRGSEHEKWSGVVTALRLDPFESGKGSVEIDHVRAADGAGGGGAGGDDPATGCSCRSAGESGGSGGWIQASLGALFAARVARRCRKRRPRPAP